jgi:hypothetical protein
MQYRKKPVVIEAITFDEFVEYGKSNGGNIVDGMPWSFSYNGHPVTHENDQCYLIPTLEGTLRFTPEDMLITGVQGEIYPCKKEIFEATYELAGLNQLTHMSFGQAIEALKDGKKVARQGWNGKGMWLIMVPGTPNVRPVAGTPYSKAGITQETNINPHIDMFTATGDMQPGWSATQTDMLADDWQIV